MLFLVIDTAGSTGGVLLARVESAASEECKAKIVGEGSLEPREFSTQLIPAIAELLRTNELTLSDVDGFAVVSGPGSFTGLRVGLSAVKAMAEVTDKPIITLSRLAIVASAADISGSPERAAQPVHAVLDAGRGEFYHGVYRDGGRTCIAETLQTSTTLTASFTRFPGLVVASEANVLDAIGALPNVTVQSIPLVTVKEALPLVVWALRTRCFSDVLLLDANYLRRLDVEGPATTLAGTPANRS